MILILETSIFFYLRWGLIFLPTSSSCILQKIQKFELVEAILRCLNFFAFSHEKILIFWRFCFIYLGNLFFEIKYSSPRFSFGKYFLCRWCLRWKKLFSKVKFQNFRTHLPKNKYGIYFFPCLLYMKFNQYTNHQFSISKKSTSDAFFIEPQKQSSSIGICTPKIPLYLSN